MDLPIDIDMLSLWLTQYGSIALFVLLALGIIALPIPEETFMVFSGVLIHRGVLPAVPTILAAFLGAVCGISVSYLLGRTVGCFLLLKYGRWVGFTQKRYHQAHDWFEKFGKWTIFFGYFIPGVRHLTGVCAGTSGLLYKQFACYAYFGALVWVSVFLSVGYFFGLQWLSLYEQIEFKIEYIILAVGIILLLFLFVYLLFKRFNKRNSK